MEHYKRYNEKKETDNPLTFKAFIKESWEEGGIPRFGIFLLFFLIGILSTMLLCKIYLELYYYEVEFTRGDSFYVAPGNFEVEGDKIKFKSLIWNRQVEGYDFRLIEPIIK